MTALVAQQGSPILHAACQALRRKGSTEMAGRCIVLSIVCWDVGLQNGTVTVHGSTTEEEGHWVDRGNGTASTSGRCGVSIMRGYLILT